MPELSFFDKSIKIESAFVTDLTSPVVSPITAIVNEVPQNYANLNYSLYQNNNLTVPGYFDRLDISFHTSHADFTVGRQAITWGVNTFWPALDLFSPFQAVQIDRDYKPGVDAARLSVPFASNSALEVVGAVLGDSFHRDGTGAALFRFNAGHVDFGFMGGDFHQNAVAGGYFSAGLAGTVLRGEVSWTSIGNGDTLDRLRMASFWRGGAGVERQITHTFNLMGEVAWNGYGTTSVSDYPALLASDFMRRGEMDALGRWHAGAMGTWQFHALAKFSNVVLVNGNDGSVVWIPWLSVSTTNNSEVLIGADFGVGSKPGPGEVPRSEYGGYPKILVGFKIDL
jgi:hypothetical protein